jgi:phosphoglycerate dehydrogenase-like enzyme
MTCIQTNFISDRRRVFRFLSIIVVSMAALALEGVSTSAWAQQPYIVTDGPKGPIPEGDFAALSKTFHLNESAKPISEMVKGWTKPTKILVLPENPKRLAWLQKAVPGVKLVAVYNREDAVREIVDADAQVGGTCDRELMALGKKLKWVQSMHSGLEACILKDPPARFQHGETILTSAKGAFAPNQAQHGIAFTMMLARGLDIFARQMERGRFDLRREKGALPPGRLRNLEGATMLIIGLGANGTRIARYANGLGMKVIGIRNTSREHPSYVDYVGLPDELPKLLPQADVVMLTVPITDKTVGLVNADFIARMKKDAFIVNMSHIQVWVQDDVVKALESGKLAGAATDNTIPGKLPENHPLFRVPNFVTTQHKGAFHDEPDGTEIAPHDGEDIWVITRENLKRFMVGGKLYSVVDPKLQY